MIITFVALATALALVVLQHILLNKVKRSADRLADAIHDIASGKLEVMIDRDGDVVIRRK